MLRTFVLARERTMKNLILNVTTDGSLNAKEALTIAGKILKEHIEKFITEKIEEPFTQEEEEVDAEKQRIASLLEDKY